MPKRNMTTPKRFALRERDQLVLKLRREDHTYAEIKEITGMDRSSANKLVQQHLASIPKAEADELRQWEREKLNRMERDTYAQAFDFRPETDSSGRPMMEPVCGEDGNPLFNEDGTPMMRFRRDVQSATAGKLLLLKIHERRCKLFGLEAPVKTENVTTAYDMIGPEITMTVVDTRGAHPVLDRLTDSEMQAVLQFVKDNNFGQQQQQLIQGKQQ